MSLLDTSLLLIAFIVIAVLIAFFREKLGDILRELVINFVLSLLLTIGLINFAEFLTVKVAANLYTPILLILFVVMIIVHTLFAPTPERRMSGGGGY